MGVVASVDYHVVVDGDGTGALTPDGDFVRVTAKGGNVLRNPLESESLITEAEISATIGL